jgi:hypothetical protein
MTQRKLSGKSEAKGRNGYYKLAAVEVWKTGDIDTPVKIDFQSKRTIGGIGAARLELTEDDARELLAALQEELSGKATEAEQREAMGLGGSGFLDDEELEDK